MTTEEKIEKISAQLYPTARAFKTIGWKKKLHAALALSEARAWDNSVSTLKTILPDNDDFTEQDCTDFERRLGMITSLGTSLADRKAAILRKMNYPGTLRARQNYRYVEAQLQAAGFNVYVHENRFSIGGGNYETHSPVAVVGDTYGDVSQFGSGQFGDFQFGSGYDTAFSLLMQRVQFGDWQFGGSQFAWRYKKEYFVANHISETQDETFHIGSNLRSTFFIGDAYLGEFADVPASRKDEFRQLILKLKPDQTVAFLFINYT